MSAHVISVDSLPVTCCQCCDVARDSELVITDVCVCVEGEGVSSMTEEEGEEALARKGVVGQAHSSLSLLGAG